MTQIQSTFQGRPSYRKVTSLWGARSTQCLAARRQGDVTVLDEYQLLIFEALTQREKMPKEITSRY